MRFRRRHESRERHPSSTLDLVALWGPDDDDAPGAAASEAPADAAPAIAAPPLVAPADAAPSVAAPWVAATSPADGVPPAGRGAARTRLPSDGRGRAARVGVLAAVIAAGLVADQVVGGGKVQVAPVAPTVAAAMAPVGALSSTWLCPALGATAASPAQGQLVIANPGAAALAATVTVVPATGAPVVQHADLPPYGRQTVALDAVAPGDYAAATVTFEGAGGAVEQEVRGPLGDSVTPCASSASDHWYFPTGETDAGANEYLSLYNPYPGPAIADVRFETELGEFVPDAFQGVVVPGSGFTVLDIGSRVRSRAQVAAVVDVRGGEVVADELQVLNTRARGLVLTLGAPAPKASWFYANGGVGPGVTERFDVFNPSAKEASVSVAPLLEQGSAEPFDLSVPPLGVASLEVDAQARIPPGVGQAWVVTSSNGVPVVPERVITSTAPGGARGTAGTIGAPAPARRWVFAAGSTTNGEDERLVLVNPGGTDAHVSVVASGNGGAVRLPAVKVPAASRVSVDVTALDPSDVVMLDVTADTPIVAERALYGRGPSDAIGIVGA